MGISDHLTCVFRNLFADQEATVRTGHGTTDWFQIGKGVHQGCILSPCLFNFYAEYIMRNAGLEETQAGIKIAGRNIYHLRYTHDTTLTAEMKYGRGGGGRVAQGRALQSHAHFRCSDSFPSEVHAKSYVYFPVLA